MYHQHAERRVIVQPVRHCLRPLGDIAPTGTGVSFPIASDNRPRAIEVVVLRPVLGNVECVHHDNVVTGAIRIVEHPLGAGGHVPMVLHSEELAEEYEPLLFRVHFRNVNPA